MLGVISARYFWDTCPRVVFCSGPVGPSERTEGEIHNAQVKANSVASPAFGQRGEAIQCGMKAKNPSTFHRAEDVVLITIKFGCCFSGTNLVSLR
jgi:hypothetical protein